ncbi:hypothetical protein ACEV9B_21475 [Vibrio parahaemolyticus]|nr:hypothetical protein [Vibrio parahaemolyticus]MDF5072692.1 hypothetical protein [Vibrio parahaemolyticus]MDF5302136.1 hypothetical protein [Vibrio parahaemolyticus]
MQLIKLIVRDGSNVIRECDFNSGLNIVTNVGEHGNQVGKSTVLRIINFCLGSNGVSIWNDPESKQVNDDIYNYVTKGGVYFELSLKLSAESDDITNIVRTIEKPKSRLKRISWINEEKYTSQKAFELAIQNTLNVSYSKPNYKTLKNRLFRVRKEVASSPLKYDNIYTSDDDYRVIYSYLFGFSAHDKIKLEYKYKVDLKSLDSREIALKNGKDISEYHLDIENCQRLISKLRSQEKMFDFSSVHTDKLKELTQIREGISSSSSNLYNLETQRDFSKRTIEQYIDKKTEVDVALLSSIYNEASEIIPDLTKSFSDVVKFHNKMLENKINFTNSQVEVISSAIDKESECLNVLLSKEKLVLKELVNEEHLAGFFMIEDKIQKESIELGKLQYVVDEVKLIQLEREGINKKLKAIRSHIQSSKLELENNLILFNSCFETLNKKLFDIDNISFTAVFNDDNSLTFKILNQEKILGDGAPRALSMSTDLAFVVYAKKKGLKLPYVTLQDYLDAIDEDKLAILAQWADKNNVQVVISVLNDKLAQLPEALKSKSIKFELSKESKFFKV